MYCVYGMAWHGMAWHGMAWHGMAWHGMAWHGMAWHGMAWHGMAWHGMAWHGMAWHGMAWHGMAWHGMAWHGRWLRLWSSPSGARHLSTFAHFNQMYTVYCYNNFISTVKLDLELGSLDQPVSGPTSGTNCLS